MNIIILSLSRTRNRVFSVAILVSCGFFILAIGQTYSFAQGQKEADLFAQSRREMVERDLRARGIKDARVLQAMDSVPRHLFVEERQRPRAYEDRPLPIGEGQTISQPYIVALMTQLLDLTGSERVLEVGTGSGYQAAVLSLLAREIYTVEIVPPLADRARATLASLGYENVWVKVGDGFFGWEEKAPFEAILVTAAAKELPEPLWRQLREGGRLVMPIGGERQTQKLIRVRKINGKRQTEQITGVLFVPMTGAAQGEAR